MSPSAGRSPELLAREQIDAQLTRAGWCVQYRPDMNLGAGLGVAVREFPTAAGPCDYLLFLDGRPAGVIEAKRAGITLTAVEAQTQDYAASLPDWLQPPVRPLPFLYECSGTETRFTNALDPTPRSRRVFNVHQPAALRRWLDDAVAIQKGRPGAPPAPTLLGRLHHTPPLEPAGMWDAQVRAVRNLEDSLRAGRPRALVQMATGAGKTFTAIAALYRLIKFGGARRVLFLVDRGNLAKQALREFQAFTPPDDGRKFTELYNVTRLTSNKIDPVNNVVITTIQRLYSILQGQPDYDPSLEERSAFDGFDAAPSRDPQPVVYSATLPPEFFDVVVIDECHRSIYTLWRQVLEYFDAALVGLTATPARQTFAFFDKNLVCEYRHEQAVRDRVNVPYEVYEIRTRISTHGAQLAADAGNPTVVGRRDRLTRAVRWETLEDDLEYAASALDRSVVARDQIRTVVREFKDKLFTDIFPGRREIPKTLIFAKTDSHAEDILDIVRQEFGLGNEQAVKITYRPEQLGEHERTPSASHRPERMIQLFRNSYQPRIAVTVDMIATGTDIKPLECVVFMRSVRSRALFEQMKGRGVRVMPDADFRAVTADAPAKTHFVIVDAVGVMAEQKADPPLIRERGLAFEKLLELVRAGNREADILSTLAGRLDRLDRRLDPEQRRALQQAGGGLALHTLVAGLLDALDADLEDDRARALYRLSAAQEPTAAQVRDAQQELRDAAARPLAHNPALCQALIDVRREQEQTLDETSLDEVLHSGAAPQHNPDYDRQLVQSFRAFVEQQREAIDALRVLYARPYGERLTRHQLRELADAIERPPRRWTTEALWAAHERIERDRVRGASQGRLWTDVVSLVRHALRPEDDLVPFADHVRARFEAWLAQQAQRGRAFSDEQRRWLELIRDRIASDAEVRAEDLDDVPFVQAGGLGRFHALFGEGYAALMAELNGELVA